MFGTCEMRTGLDMCGELSTSSLLEQLSLEKPCKSEQERTDASVLGQNSL